ncbi:hypothetical protein AWJ20_3753 [Sugiyamaella lignohabitans]|uniref:Molybdenum cofactor sulfurase n=1 Tax=Sugiyamaella lignohabitans TaxID=796027 RepID=A0A167BXT4_9ASCO|nr:uncharacterized protein AWJ20_3753 [Sugiyamaella lignohabitans]ANB10959.1 hypothetical protein AWJ20_3753 [Sugiyamaella lignohabitans]
MPEAAEVLDGYGYDGKIDEIRKLYYGQLDKNGNDSTVYLDHAGTTLYPTSIVDKFSATLVKNIYGNPHSKSPSSQNTERWIERARGQFLGLFGADVRQYSVVFTANSTAAVKLIGEGLSTLPNSKYTYLKDSHTSLVGLRNLASSFEVTGDIEQYLLSLERQLEKENSTHSNSDLEVDDFNGNGHKSTSGNSELLSWPAQSNFSGKRYPCEEWLNRVRFINRNNSSSDHRLYTLLDAAAISSSKPIDLLKLNPDFVIISCYKIFGFPDLGALIVKNEVLPQFFANRKYFGGGTLDSLASETDFVARKSLTGSQALEDGTLPFHSIIGLSIAIDEYKRIYGSFDNISLHTSSLAGYLHRQLERLKYSNGQPLVHIYGPNTEEYKIGEHQGPIVAFNLKFPSGEWIGYSDLETIASSQNINLRTGTLCNSGSASTWMNISDSEIISNYSSGHVCGDTNDIMNGKPTGAVRVSLGACSSIGDVDALINCLTDFYLKPFNQELAKAPLTSAKSLTTTARITALSIYPIKSCAAYNISTPWVVGANGLKWDREFCLVNMSSYSVLSLKKYPKMVHILPKIDGDRLLIRYNDNEISVPLRLLPSNSNSETTLKVCGNNIFAQIYTDATVVKFFTSALGIDCTLARIHNDPQPATNTEITREQPGTMVNSSPILLISQSSVNKLSSNTLNSSSSDDDQRSRHQPVDRQIFRANITISGPTPYSEDEWTAIQTDTVNFKVCIKSGIPTPDSSEARGATGSGAEPQPPEATTTRPILTGQLLGKCQRCNMVCVDASTGQRNQAPFKALHRTRKENVSYSRKKGRKRHC